MKFCPHCATLLEPKVIESRNCFACPNCNWIYWNNPVPAAGCVVEESGKVLLILRKNPPYAGKWSVPVGFLHFGETAEQAAVRELEEETGLKVEPVALIGSYTDIVNESRSHLVLIYRARVIGGELAPGDDASQVHWFPLHHLPEMAFPAADHIFDQMRLIRDGPPNALHFCPRCRGKLERRLIGNHSHPACPTCHYIHFHNPIPVAEAVVTDSENRVLLVKRKLPPRIGDWALPGGFVDFMESAEQAAIREVVEETGLQIRLKRLLCTLGLSSMINPEQCILKAIFEAEIAGGELQAADDAEDAKFFALDELPSNLANESVREALRALGQSV